MLQLNQIEDFYPVHLRHFKRNMIREYLQYKILESVYSSSYANELSFLGGTALRIVYQNSRFSEDIDFDNFGMTEADFAELSKIIRGDLEQEGFKVEVRNVFKGAYHCYIKIPELLYRNNLSPLKEEKILIQVDTVPHFCDYKPEDYILNKFDVFTGIKITPKSVLLSQKIHTAFNRKKPKGRDFFDIIFLLSLKTEPDYSYLKKVIDVADKTGLKKYILEHSKSLDFSMLAKDVADFLFNPKDVKKIEGFYDYIRQRPIR